MQKVQYLCSVVHDHDFICQIQAVQRRERQLDVIGIVFRKQNGTEICHGDYVDRPDEDTVIGSEK